MSNIFYYAGHEIITWSAFLQNRQQPKWPFRVTVTLVQVLNEKSGQKDFFVGCWDSACLWIEPSRSSSEETVERGTCKGRQRKFYLLVSSFRRSSFLTTNRLRLTVAQISVPGKYPFYLWGLQIRFPFSFGLSVLQGTFNEVQQSHGASESQLCLNCTQNYN